MTWYQTEPKLNIINSPSYDPRYHVKEAILSYLRASIIRGDLKPGQALHESTLTKQFGASRSPVREALVQLEQEGLVKTVPKKGTFITKIDKSQLRQSLFIRSTLESSNIEMLSQNISKIGIQELRENIERQRISLSVQNFPQLYDDMDQFHLILFSLNRLPRIWELIRREKISLDRLHALNISLDQISQPRQDHNYRMSFMFDQHIELVDALEKGETEKCLSIIRTHADIDFEAMDFPYEVEASENNLTKKRNVRIEE